MLVFILTTGECNLECSYCGGSFPLWRVPWRERYSLEELKQSLEGAENLAIAFYGGEPLLNVRFMEKVMDEVEAEHFIVQTNGTLVEKLHPDYWRRMDAVLLSIDGVREVTNYYRGMGVYERVVEAAKYLRRIGFEGDLIARMTISRRSDVFRDVKHLLELGLFDHVHWQLDVVWSERWRGFREWVETSYKPGIAKLVELWMSELKKGRILGLVPFLGILQRELFNRNVAPPCGAGSESVAISTDGRILACPIAVDVKWAELGVIGRNRVTDVVGKVGIKEPCTSCRFFKWCGGRCLYAHKERLWGEEGFQEICEVTSFTIMEILERKKEILKLVEEGAISLEDLNYPPFNNSTEIIP